jgi:hypothetical protein
MDTWEKIRGAFSEDEKEDINAAIVGVPICLRGCVLDEALMPAVLVIKLKAAKKAQPHVDPMR